MDLPDADGHHHVRDALPLEATLHRESGLIVENPVNDAFAREDEVAGEYRRIRKIAVQLAA
jgi:hypothetical protein